MQGDRGVRRIEVGGSVPRPGGTDLMKALFAAKTQTLLFPSPKPPCCSFNRSIFPAFLPALQKNLTNMLCEISELIRPNGVRFCHWLFWGRAACVMEENFVN